MRRKYAGDTSHWQIDGDQGDIARVEKSLGSPASLGVSAMSNTGLKQLDHAVNSVNIWLAEIMDKLDVDRSTAWHALGAVLHTLRDRLTTDEIRHLGAQLPLIIRGLFFDQWTNPKRSPKIHNRVDFLARVKKRLNAEKVDAGAATTVIFGVLSRHPKGEVQKILKNLPLSLRKLAPTVAERDLKAESPFAWE